MEIERMDEARVTMQRHKKESILTVQFPTRAISISPVVSVGSNAWRQVLARRVSMLVDASNYYRHLENALINAQKLILIAGWDFNGQIKLRPDQHSSEQLGTLLRRLVDEKPDLSIYILIWASGPIYSARQMRFFPCEPWADHPRIKLCYDNHHPWRGSHHQKIVCIDDSLAFSGGIDLTIHRWDTPDHEVNDRRRRDIDGKFYDAVHDVQMAVDHLAAKSLADLVRERWRACNGYSIAPLGVLADRWPQELKPDLRHIRVSIARTIPPSLRNNGIREIERLNEAALKSARQFIYIETQYLTCRKIGKLIAQRLTEPNGPEIAIVVPKECHGRLERIFMGGNRDRLARRLLRADIYNRLRIVYPSIKASGLTEETPIFVHSKVMIIDDRFLRIGSSNFNNRSRGMDSECDLAVEATSRTDRETIKRMRSRLLAEHLGLRLDVTTSYIRKSRSIISLIDMHCNKQRCLRPIFAGGQSGSETAIPLTTFIDPKLPFQPHRYIVRLANRLRSWIRA